MMLWEGLCDDDYIRAHTKGFSELKGWCGNTRQARVLFGVRLILLVSQAFLPRRACRTSRNQASYLHVHLKTDSL
jgi:hypothetical protein